MMKLCGLWGRRGTTWSVLKWTGMEMTNDHSLIKDIFYLFQLFVLILFCTCFGYFCFSDSTDSNGQRLWVVWAIIFQLIWRRSWQTPNTPCIVQCLYVHLMHTPAPRKTHSPVQCITQVLIIHLVCTLHMHIFNLIFEKSALQWICSNVDFDRFNFCLKSFNQSHND